MGSSRWVEPEWLDRLPAHDARAVRSRSDLARINRWMQQPGIMARALRQHGGAEPPRVVLDLGAGDGTFMLRVARRLVPRWPDVTLLLLDRQDIVSPGTRRGFAALGWKAEPVVADVFDFLGRARPLAIDVVTANLFLHHFRQERLTRLLADVARVARLVVACEPRRAPLASLASRLVWAIGCNGVTRHDVVVSVRAGFRGHELSALWPTPDAWQLNESGARLFTHCFVARHGEAGAK